MLRDRNRKVRLAGRIHPKKQGIGGGQAERVELCPGKPGEARRRALGIGADDGLQVGQHQKARARCLGLRLDELGVASLGTQSIKDRRGADCWHAWLRGEAAR
jgi:hypothetical protein